MASRAARRVCPTPTPQSLGLSGADRTTNPPMDTTTPSESLNGTQSYVALAAAALTALVFLVWYSYDSEAAVDYSVEPPEQCLPGYKGRELDSPSLNVCCPRPIAARTRC